MIPVICHGCGQRGKVASIPSDLACVACRSTDIDLDDAPRRTAAKDYQVWCSKCGKEQKIETPSDADSGKTFYCEDSSCGGRLEAWKPEPKEGSKTAGPYGSKDDSPLAIWWAANDLLPDMPGDAANMSLAQTWDDPRFAGARMDKMVQALAGVLAMSSDPKAAALLERLRGARSKTASKTALGDPDMPAGLLPNDQPEMALLTEPKVTEGVRCSVCFHEFTHQPVDPAQRLPACPNCGNDVTTAAGTSAIITARRRYFASLAKTSAHDMVECGNCNGSGAIPAQGGEKPEDIDNGYAKCPECDGNGEVFSTEATKVGQIAKAILDSNPHMDPRTAARVARETVARYPKVARRVTAQHEYRVTITTAREQYEYVVMADDEHRAEDQARVLALADGWPHGLGHTNVEQLD